MNKAFLYFYTVFLLIISSLSNFAQTTKKQNNNDDFYAAFHEGNMMKIKSNYKNAISYYLIALSINKKSSTTNYLLAGSYFITENYDSAIYYAKQAIKINSNNIWYHDLLLNCYIKTNQLQNCISTLKSIVIQFPSNLNYKKDLAKLYQQSYKFNEALQIYNEIEIQYGMSEEISLLKCQLYFYNKQDTKAIKEIEKLCKFFNSEMRYKGILAEYYIKIKDYEKAKEVYTELQKNYPDNMQVLLSFTNFLRITNHTTDIYTNLVHIFKSDDIETATKISHLSYYYKQNDKSILTNDQYGNLLEIIYSKEYTNESILEIYSNYLYQEGKFEQIIEILSRLIENKTGNYTLWQKLINSCLLVGNNQKALIYSKAAIDLFPEQPSLYLYKGISELNSGFYNESVNTLKSGLSILVDNTFLEAQFYFNLAEAYHKINNHKLSDNYFEKVLFIEPNNKFALNNYAFYLALRSIHLEKARNYSLRCIELEPHNPNYIDTYAFILYKLNNFDEAKKYILKALDLSSERNATILEHYGDILVKLNDKLNALIYYKKAYKITNNKNILEKINEIEKK